MVRIAVTPSKVEPCSMLPLGWECSPKIAPRQPFGAKFALQRARYMTLETMETLSDNAVVGLPAMVV
jgi:hypothetical protein